MTGNPYHDAKGLFSSANGDADGKASGGRSSTAVKQSVDLEAARRRLEARTNKQKADAEYYKRHGETPRSFKDRQAAADKKATKFHADFAKRINAHIQEHGYNSRPLSQSEADRRQRAITGRTGKGNGRRD